MNAWYDLNHKTYLRMDDGEEIAVWSSRESGIPLVFVHGFPESHNSWIPIFRTPPFDNDSDFRIITYDLRGHGESSKNGEATWQRFVMDHLNILKALGIENYHLIGHDWGGAIALHMARIAPETLKSATVLNTNFWKTDLKGMWHLTFFNLPMIAPLAFKFAPDKIFSLFLEKTFINPDCIDSATKENYKKSFSDKATTRYWIRLYQSMARALIAQAAPKSLKNKIARTQVVLPKTSKDAFKIPIQLIWGKQDTFNPLWIAKDMEQRLSELGATVELREVDASGHFVCEEQPATVARILSEFLKKRG